MPAITINIPDRTYRAALAFAPAERMRLATIALTHAFPAEGTALEEDGDIYDEPPTNATHIEAIRDALAEEDAGLCIDGNVFMAQLKEKRRWTK